MILMSGLRCIPIIYVQVQINRVTAWESFPICHCLDSYIKRLSGIVLVIAESCGGFIADGALELLRRTNP